MFITSSARSACLKSDYYFAVNRMREQTESMAANVSLFCTSILTRATHGLLSRGPVS